MFDGAVGGIVSGIVLALVLGAWRHLRRAIYTERGTPQRPPEVEPGHVWVLRGLVGSFEAKGWRRVLAGLLRRETVWVDHRGQQNVLMREGKR